MTGKEQRQRDRARVWLPIKMKSDAGEMFAVTYDTSAQGVLVLAPQSLGVGARVTLTFEIPGEPPKSVTATGQVVRVEPNVEDPEGLWPHRVAVTLDGELGMLRADFDAATWTAPE